MLGAAVDGSLSKGWVGGIAVVTLVLGLIIGNLLGGSQAQREIRAEIGTLRDSCEQLYDPVRQPDPFDDCLAAGFRLLSLGYD